MKNTPLPLFVVLLVSLFLSACQPIAPVEPTPVEKPLIGDDFIYGADAVVESLDVLIMESFPVMVRAVLSGYLPDGCTELVAIDTEQQDDDFMLTLTTRRPSADVMCTQALVPFEEMVDLPVEGLQAGTYTVIAQDKQAQFKLDTDNFHSGEGFGPIAGGGDELVPGTDAVVEVLSLMVMESYPVQVNAQLSGYLPDGCTTIREVRATREGNTFRIQVLTQRPGGDVACIMVLMPFEETVSLAVEGLPAGEYIVQAGDLREVFTLESDN